MSGGSIAVAGRDPFFIFGCQRGGTTLLSMILAVHEGVDMIDEDDQRFHQPGRPTFLLRLDSALAHARESERVVGYKAPRDTHRYREFADAIADPKFIWVWRPLEQTVNSMCELVIAPEVQPWAITHGPRELEKYIGTFTDDAQVAETYRRASMISDDRGRALALGTICWVAKERTRTRMVAEFPGAVHIVTYRDLVESPRVALVAICEWLGLPWSERLLQHHLLGRGPRIGNADAARRIDRISLDSWRSRIDDEDLLGIDDVLESLGEPTLFGQTR